VSVETTTYRRCDMCKREIKAEFFFKCQNIYANQLGMECIEDRPSTLKTALDVCLDCWDKMQDRYAL
jgi:hypothetical protein